MRLTIEELSRLLDGEISAEERRDIENRLATCPASQALKEAMHTLSQAFVEALLAAPLPAAAPAENCPDDETIANLIDRELSDGEKAAAEEHFSRCPRCLQAVARHLRVSLRLQAGGWPALPPQVAVEASQPRILVHAQTPPPSEKWQTLRIVLERQAVVSRCLSAKTLVASFILTRLDDEQVSLELEVKEKQRPSAGQSVIVIHRKSRRKHFSGATDARGRLEIPRLAIGAYDIHFVATGLKVELRVEKTDTFEKK